MPIAQADTAINGTTKWQRHWERYPATLKWSFHPSIPVFERAIALALRAIGEASGKALPKLLPDRMIADFRGA